MNPVCFPESVDVYTVRRAVVRALRAALPHFSGVVADIGAGVSPYRRLVLEAQGVTRYVALDLAGNPYQPPDVIWDGRDLPFQDDSVGCAMATEVLEHCPDPERVMAEACRVLKPGGVFFLTVPFLWPLHDVPSDEYRFTPWSLQRHLENAGFENPEIRPLGGYEASLAQMIGLYVRRRSRTKSYTRFLRPVLSAAAVPLVWGLTRLDRPPKDYREGLMVTGFWALARKAGR